MSDAAARSEVEQHLNRNILAQLLHGMLGQTGFRLIQAPTFVPAYLFMLSGSDFVVGLARSVQALGTVISPFIGASMIGHRRRILGMTLGMSALMRIQILGLSVTGFLLGKGDIVWSFIVLMALMGFFQGMSQVTMNSLRAKVVPIRRRGIVSGMRNFLAGFTSAGVSYVAGAYFIEQNIFGNGYATVFLVAFVITSFGLAGLAITKEPLADVVRERESVLQTLRGMPELLARDVAFLRFFIARAFGSFGTMALPFYILFAGSQMQISGAELGLLTTVWMITSSTTNLIWGVIADRKGYRVVMIATLAFWIASHVVILFVEDLVDMGIFFVIMGMASGGYNQAGQNMVLEFGAVEDIPLRLATSGSAVNLIATVGPVLGGLIVVMGSYFSLFVTTIVLQLIALVILILWVPEPRDKEYGSAI